MNYTIDDFRSAYHKQEEQEQTSVDDDTLRMLGYTEEDIAKRIDKD